MFDFHEVREVEGRWLVVGCDCKRWKETLLRSFDTQDDAEDYAEGLRDEAYRVESRYGDYDMCLDLG